MILSNFKRILFGPLEIGNMEADPLIQWGIELVWNWILVSARLSLISGLPLLFKYSTSRGPNWTSFLWKSLYYSFFLL